jgi:hypothetical protein
MPTLEFWEAITLAALLFLLIPAAFLLRYYLKPRKDGFWNWLTDINTFIGLMLVLQVFLDAIFQIICLFK